MNRWFRVYVCQVSATYGHHEKIELQVPNNNVLPHNNINCRNGLGTMEMVVTLVVVFLNACIGRTF